MRRRTPWGEVELAQGRVLQVRARRSEAAFCAVGWVQARRWPDLLERGLARGAGRAAQLDPGKGARHQDRLWGELGTAGRARRRLAAAGPLYRRCWGAYAWGLDRAWRELGRRPPPAPITPANLAAWDYLLAALPETGDLFGSPPGSGSNALALPGGLVRGGAGLLWFDPHLPLEPRGDLAFHGLCIRTFEYKACGLARVGSPFVLAGAGPKLAWTLCASWCESLGGGPAEQAFRRGWCRAPSGRRALAPAFTRCPLPAAWFFAAARASSAPGLVRRSAHRPPLAHTHLVAADRAGRTAWCLASAAPGGHRRPLHAGGVLLQCNAAFTRVRRERPLAAADFHPSFLGGPGEDRSWRQVRAREILDALLHGQGPVGPEALLVLARDECDPAARLLARHLTAGGRRAPALAGWGGGLGRGSCRGALAMLVLAELVRGRPLLDRVLPLERACTRLLAGVGEGELAAAWRAGSRRWRRLGRPTWGRLHGGRGGSANTLLAHGGSPWRGLPFPAGEGSLLPGVVRLGPAGAVLFLPDPRRPAQVTEIRLQG